LDLCDLLGLWVVTIADGFVFCRRDVTDRAVQPALVPPMRVIVSSACLIEAP
jgi:hypothetical protein